MSQSLLKVARPSEASEQASGVEENKRRHYELEAVRWYCPRLAIKRQKDKQAMGTKEPPRDGPMQEERKGGCCILRERLTMACLRAWARMTRTK